MCIRDSYIRQTRTPTVSCSAAAEDLTQRKPNPWFVRTVGSSAQPNHALGEYAAKTLGYKRVAIIADDFAYGHETAAGFQRCLLYTSPSPQTPEHLVCR